MSIRSWSGMERLKWELSDILPIEHRRLSPVGEYLGADSTNFRVSLNDELLIANDPTEEIIAHSPPEGISIGRLHFRYAIGTGWQSIHPDEARGIRVRLNHVGVGQRTYFDLNVQGRTFSRLHWLSGEVNVSAGLDEAITLDRDTFSSTDEYEDLRENLRMKLREMAFFVEDVDVARRKIAAQTAHSPRAVTAPTSAVITEQLERLRRRGFEVREEPPSGREPTVEIDTQEKVITIKPAADPASEAMTVAGRRWIIGYASWDYANEYFKACRITPDGRLEFNLQYPLFHGIHQDLFRKLQVLLTDAERSAGSKEDMYDAIQLLLLTEFR